MAQHQLAVLPGAAASPTAGAQRAHDIVVIHDADSRPAKPMWEAAQAMNTTTSLHLGPATINRAVSPPHVLQLRSPYLQASPQDGSASDDHLEPGITRTAQDTKEHLLAAVDGNLAPDQAAPPPSLTPQPQLLHGITPLPTPPSPSPTNAISKISASATASHHSSENQSSHPRALQKPHNGAAGSANIPHERNMLFPNRAMGAGSAAYRRRQYANTNALTVYEADLTGTDRAKQKEAVRKMLVEKVKDDWKWDWPRPEAAVDPQAQTEVETQPRTDADLGLEAVSTSSPLHPVDTHESEREESAGEAYEEQWKERDEWTSNASDSGEDKLGIPAKRAERQQSNTTHELGAKSNCTTSGRNSRRKQRLAEEMAWNDGVRCFVERRDAWTGARRVAHSPSIQPRLTLAEQLRRSTSQSSHDEGSSTAIEPEGSDADAEVDWEADTEVPIARPLIPPENAMRASITPSAYNTIYDKVILQNLTPGCPINLKDITRSCVQGWKRDGEWPPKSSIPDSLAGRRRRKLSMASLFGLEKTRSKEDQHKVEKEKADKEAQKSSDDHKPGAIKKLARKLLLLGKDKDHEKENPSKENGHVSNGSNGKAR